VVFRKMGHFGANENLTTRANEKLTTRLARR
jgi:hypothetical protein